MLDGRDLEALVLKPVGELAPVGADVEHPAPEAGEVRRGNQGALEHFVPVRHLRLRESFTRRGERLG